MIRINLRTFFGLLCSTFYGDFDNWRRGIEHYVCELGGTGDDDQALDVTRGTMVVYRYPDEKHYRVGWRVKRDEAGNVVANRYGEPDVEFDAVEAWVEVTPEFEWAEQDRALARLEKMEFGPNGTGRQLAFGTPGAALDLGAEQTRRLSRSLAGAEAEPVLPDDGETRFTVARQIRMTSDENRSTVFFTAGSVDRHRTYVEPAGVDTTDWERNPVVLWDHGRDPRRGNLPIARGVSVEDRTITIDGVAYRGKLATIEWADDEFARGIRDMVRSGFLNMASMGWLPLEMGEHSFTEEGRTYRVPSFVRSEMTEFSIVAIGSNRQAFVQERARLSGRPAGDRTASGVAADTSRSDTSARSTPAPSPSPAATQVGREVELVERTVGGQRVYLADDVHRLLGIEPAAAGGPASAAADAATRAPSGAAPAGSDPSGAAPSGAPRGDAAPAASRSSADAPTGGQAADRAPAPSGSDVPADARASGPVAEPPFLQGEALTRFVAETIRQGTALVAEQRADARRLVAHATGRA